MKKEQQNNGQKGLDEAPPLETLSRGNTEVEPEAPSVSLPGDISYAEDNISGDHALPLKTLSRGNT